MAEEQALTAEEQLDAIIRLTEKTDRAQDLELVSKFTVISLKIALGPTTESLIRTLHDTIKNKQKRR